MGLELTSFFQCLVKMVGNSQQEFKKEIPSMWGRGTMNPGEDAFKALGIAEVMEKAGCPIPPEMQQMVDSSWAASSRTLVDGYKYR